MRVMRAVKELKAQYKQKMRLCARGVFSYIPVV